MAIRNIEALSRASEPLRAEVHWIGSARRELTVFHIPVEHLYFNIENGRYADRMIRLRHENPGVVIDPRLEKWKAKIEEMLAGEHKDTARDRSAFERLLEDIRNRTQLRPGVVTRDGGVIDGNRRFAALRRLGAANRDRFRDFDAVVLPAETTPEDRWRIEAGLQLGLNERWDYSPINELLKIRDGVRMYESMIQAGSLSQEADASRLVAEAIYGRTEAQIREMMARLELIDEYLEFTGRPGSYDAVGPLSERFLEASRVVQAAENQNHDPSFLARLKAALFYLIDRGQMDNWELRKVYEALGGDPKKRGRKPRGANVGALNDLLSDFPDPRRLRSALREVHAVGGPGSGRRAASVAEAGRPGKPGGDPVDSAKIGAATEKFIRTMESAALSKTPRKVAAGAGAEIAALHAALQDKKILSSMTVDDRAAVMEAIAAMQTLLVECRVRLTKL